MKMLKAMFSGARFWGILGIVNFIMAIILSITGTFPILELVVMWVSFATYEILKKLETISNTEKESNAV